MDQVYHVYNRGINRQDIFLSPQDYEDLLDLMEKNLPRFRVRIYAYVLMPNHFHMILFQEEPFAISRFLQAVTGQYARRFNARYGRVGHVFQGRHKRRRVKTEKQLVQLSRYIHLNPVQAGLVKLPEEGECGSCAAYLGGRDDELINREPILSLIGGQDAYARYLHDLRPNYGEELEKLLIERCVF